jgi:endoribonuclease Dicer
LEGGVLIKKPQMHVHMPPELLIRIDVSREVLRSFYLLPSVMHRLESLMLASQLREEIDCCSSNFHISSTLVCPIIWLLSLLVYFPLNHTVTFNLTKVFCD